MQRASGPALAEPLRTQQCLPGSDGDCLEEGKRQDRQSSMRTTSPNLAGLLKLRGDARHHANGGDEAQPRQHLRARARGGRRLGIQYKAHAEMALARKAGGEKPQDAAAPSVQSRPRGAGRVRACVTPLRSMRKRFTVQLPDEMACSSP